MLISPAAIRVHLPSVPRVAVRVPAVHLKVAFWPVLSFLPVCRMNKLRMLIEHAGFVFRSREAMVLSHGTIPSGNTSFRQYDLPKLIIS